MSEKRKAENPVLILRDTITGEIYLTMKCEPFSPDDWVDIDDSSIRGGPGKISDTYGGNTPSAKSYAGKFDMCEDCHHSFGKWFALKNEDEG